MLTRIDVDGENSFYVPILGATPKGSLFIQKITGLNPPDVTLFVGDYARDGGTYQGRRVGSRNVVLIFDLNPNPALGETIKGLRQMLYKAFLDPTVEADYVKLKLYDDEGRILYVVGYTEKIEAEIFDIETMVQVSIVCPDPYIRDEIETVKTDPIGWATVPFTYRGTAETGFETEIHITSDTPTLTLDNNGKKMVFNREFLVDDVVTINTNRGSLSATLSREGDPDKSIVASMTTLSTWLYLHSQSNVMKVYGETDVDFIAAARSLAYRQAYWGV